VASGSTSSTAASMSNLGYGCGAAPGAGRGDLHASAARFAFEQLGLRRIGDCGRSSNIPRAVARKPGDAKACAHRL